MANLVGTLARRGVEVVRDRAGQGDEDMPLSPWAVALFGATFLAFVVFGSSIEYTIRILMGHLAIVESPNTTTVEIYTPASGIDSLLKKEAEAQGLLEVELEATTVTSTKPLTSSIRRTARHLKSIGGFKAKWRGLGIYIVYTFITIMVSGALNKMILRLVPFGEMLSNIAAALLTSRMHCAWTHKVITMPSGKKLWERRVSRANWKQLLAPTAMSMMACDLSIEAIKYIFVLSVAAAQAMSTKTNVPSWTVLVMGVVPGVVAMVSLPVFVVLPAYAALIRKEASLLPEEDETIVSFDRTFGGKLNQVGAVLSYKDAWKSFDGEARRRVVKLYAKFFFIMIACTIVMAHVFALELFMGVGDKVPEYALQIRQRMREIGY